MVMLAISYGNISAILNYNYASYGIDLAIMKKMWTGGHSRSTVCFIIPNRRLGNVLKCEAQNALVQFKTEP